MKLLQEFTVCSGVPVLDVENGTGNYSNHDMQSLHIEISHAIYVYLLYTIYIVYTYNMHINCIYQMGLQK